MPLFRKMCESLIPMSKAKSGLLNSKKQSLPGFQNLEGFCIKVQYIFLEEIVQLLYARFMSNKVK